MSIFYDSVWEERPISGRQQAAITEKGEARKVGGGEWKKELEVESADGIEVVRDGLIYRQGGHGRPCCSLHSMNTEEGADNTTRTEARIYVI